MRPIATIFLLLLFCFDEVQSQDVLPASSVEDIEGKELDLSAYIMDGNPKIISLWATWCGPCRMELNALKKVYPRWKKLYNVEIIAVTIDFPSMLNRAKKMFEQNEWEYTFFHDKKQELMDKMGVRGIPYSMLIDGSGRIQSVQMGYFPGYEKDLENKIKALKS